MPSAKDITNLIDDSAVKSVLKFWISNLKLNHLDNDEDTRKALRKFTRMALEIHLSHIFNGNEKTRYGVDVLDKVKGDRLKNITKDIHVPSFSNTTNLADSVDIS